MPEYEIGARYPLPKPKSSKRLRDVVPNGEDFRSRNYGVSKEVAKDDATGGSEIYQMLKGRAKDVPCPECKVDVGYPCISISKAQMGVELDGFHGGRITAIRTVLARK